MKLLDPTDRTVARPLQPAAAALRTRRAAASSSMADHMDMREANLVRLSSRLLMSIGAVAVVAAPLLMLAYRSTLSGPALIVSFLLSGLLGLAFLVAAAAVRRGKSTAAYVIVLTASFAVVVGYAVVTQAGVHSIVMGFLVLLIAAAGVLLSSAWAVGVGVASVVTVIALYFAETSGLIAGREAVQAIPVLSRTLAALLMVAVSTLTTLLLARLVVNALRDKLKQEHRFRALLGIASDWYWEQDVELRYTRISSVVAGSGGLAEESNIGLARWELPGIDPRASDWDVHRADLLARRAFRDFRYAQTRADGSRVTIAASGEPTFDSLGRFTGYWGVARDVTEEERARVALRTGDLRYRELFMASPSPFILHRKGVVLFGNRAAAVLFGFEQLKDFEGFDIAQLTAPDDRALSRSRLATLEQSPPGGAVPTIELKMVKLDGTQLTVEVRAIRVDLADGPANLSLYFDLTERKLAESELRHSRTMLSHLFQASPDYITVSDMDTGRLEMVNEGFERLTGHRMADAVGRTTIELGLWADPEQRRELISAVRNRGIVHDMPVTLRRRDGELRKVLTDGASFELEGKSWLVATARDITDSEQQRLRYEAILGSASVGIALTRDRRFEHANRRVEAMFGWDEGQLIGQPSEVVWVSAEDFAEFGRAVDDALARGEAVDLERTMRRRDGSTFLCRLQGRVVDPRAPAASGTIWFVEDVTERRAEQKRLAHSQALLSRVIEANPDFVALSELETGRYVLVNEGLTRMTGYSREEAIGRSSLDLGLWADPQERIAVVAQLRAHGSVQAFPAHFRSKDGRDISALISAATIEVDRKTLVTSTTRDVTDSEHLRQEYEAILANASIGIAITRDRAFRLANPRFEQMFGWTAGALAGQPGGVVWLSDDDYAEIGRTAGPVLARGEPIELERRMRRRDGSEFWCRLLGRAIDTNHPGRGGTIWIAEDVTERRAEQERLAQSQALLSLVVEANPEYVALSELATGKFIVVNEGFTRMVGYERSEAIGRSALDLGVWFDPHDRDNLVTQLRAHGSVRAFPARLRCKDGRIISTLISSATFVVDGKALVSSTVRDVTDSERARMEYEAILANASIGIAFTRDRTFLHANSRWEEMFGWLQGTLTGQPGKVVWLSDDDYADVGRTAGPVLARGEPVELERPMRRRDGSTFFARVLGRAIDPSHPSRGGTIWIAEDITERRATQDALAAAKGQAEAASRAKSAFLANTSHEIRTPLNGLLGLARLALDRKLSDKQRIEYLKGINESAEQLGGLISDILDLSKIEAGKLTLEAVAFDLHAMLGNVYAGYRELASGKGLACSLHLDPRVPRYVTGDPTRVRQVVSNFVTNALKFTERGQVDLCAEMMESGAIRLAVVDSGLGIDEATLARLFTPFTQGDESTTRRYGGTGLGLSICRQLADLMGGTVGVDSEPGAGSTFWAELPLPAAADAPEAQAAIEESSLAGVRVLLVEDNAVNMLIAATMLESWDAEVKQVTDGRQAVDTVTRLQQDPATAFDLVLMDVHMPVMSGHEATIALRKHFGREKLPIVALTAAALLNEQEASLALGMNDFVTKPVDANRLRSVVARWARRTVRT